MATALLLLFLAGGETAPITMDRHSCRTLQASIADAVGADRPVSVESNHGHFTVAGALCFDMITSDDPCEESGA